MLLLLFIPSGAVDQPVNEFGARAATAAEVTQWIQMVKAVKRAQRGWQQDALGRKDETELRDQRTR